MELLAVIVALEKIKIENQHVHIYTDSKYVSNSVEKKWVFGWEKKDFKNKKNPDLWSRFLKTYRKHHVSFFWIKAHNNNLTNERCDFLAVEASKKSRLKIDKGYEK
jgi:ribonuclease HI